MKYHTQQKGDTETLETLVQSLPENLRATTKEILVELGKGNLPESQQITDIYQPTHIDLDASAVDKWLLGNDGSRNIPYYGSQSREERQRQASLIAQLDDVEKQMHDWIWTSKGQYVCDTQHLSYEDKEIVKSFFEGKNKPKDNPLGGENAPQEEVLFVVEKTQQTDSKTGLPKNYIGILSLNYGANAQIKWQKVREIRHDFECVNMNIDVLVWTVHAQGKTRRLSLWTYQTGFFLMFFNIDLHIRCLDNSGRLKRVS